MRSLLALLRETRAVIAIQYGLVAALIALAAITMTKDLGGQPAHDRAAATAAR